MDKAQEKAIAEISLNPFRPQAEERSRDFCSDCKVHWDCTECSSFRTVIKAQLADIVEEAAQWN